MHPAWGVQSRLDGELRSGLRSHLTALAPVEILLPCGGLSSATHRALAASAVGAQVRQLPAHDFWGADRLRKELKKSCYFGDGPVPTSLQVASLVKLCSASVLRL